MPNNSSATTNGKLVRNSTCLVYAAGPLTAKALEMKCSIRNNPTGTMPVSECRRRSRKECPSPARSGATPRSEEHTSELQSHSDLVCRLLLEKKKNNNRKYTHISP